MVHMAVQKRKKSTRLYQEAHTDNRIMDYCDFSNDGDAKNNYSDCLVAVVNSCESASVEVFCSICSRIFVW